MVILGTLIGCYFKCFQLGCHFPPYFHDCDPQLLYQQLEWCCSSHFKHKDSSRVFRSQREDGDASNGDLAWNEPIRWRPRSLVHLNICLSVPLFCPKYCQLPQTSFKAYLPMFHILTFLSWNAGWVIVCFQECTVQTKFECVKRTLCGFPSDSNSARIWWLRTPLWF